VNGFKNIAPGPNQDGILTQWDPEQGNQFEAGFKLDLFAKKLLSTVSYYNMRIKNRVIADPGGLGSRQDGNIKNQGFEIDLVINPVKGWNIVVVMGSMTTVMMTELKMPENWPGHLNTLPIYGRVIKLWMEPMKGWALVQDLIL
jgi:outer membrane receptor protein involved in Fe transport